MTRTLAIILGAGLAAWGQDQAAKPEDLERWVRDLGSEEFAVRDKADKALRAAGRSALPYLDKALASEDLEVRERAEAIKKGIEAKKREEPQKEAGRQAARFNVQVRVVGPDGYALSMSPDGVRLEKDGKTYEARDAEEFQSKFPELYDKYVKPNAAQKGPARSFRLPGPRNPQDWWGFHWWADPAEPPGPGWGLEKDSLDDLFKKLFPPDNAQLEDLLKDLRQRIQRNRQDLERYSREFSERFRRELEGKPHAAPTDLGLRLGEVDDEARKNHGLAEDEGVLVLGVKDKGLAGRLGLRKDDIILSVGGARIRNTIQARTEMARAVEGAEIAVEIIRGNDRQTLKAKTDDLKGF